MAAVERRVQHIIQKIGRRRQDTERQESQEACGPGLDVLALPGQHQRNEYEHILRPLMQSHRIDKSDKYAFATDKVLF